ncbi:Tfp pilus assembly protein FimT/FimU [Pontiella sp.]|uniref:Tfp pilus assembly protein FimT/FimU n=1 Tax=Pontiella sp. TaxID=2837462 RepID=UPI003565C6E4
MQSNGQPANRNGFTLAELLVVIAIIAIMFLIALPALMDIAGQTKLDSAANAVHSAAKLARQFAVANNQPTYLVFNEGQTDAALAYRAYAVFTVDIHSPPVTQEDGEFLTPWEPLPPGVVFDATASEDNNNVFLVGGSWAGGFGRNRQLRVGNSTYVALGFKPTGTQNLAYTHDIHLAEGFYDEVGQLVHTSVPGQGARIRIEGGGDSWIAPIVYDESGEIAEIAQ